GVAPQRGHELKGCGINPGTHSRHSSGAFTEGETIQKRMPRPRHPSSGNTIYRVTPSSHLERRLRGDALVVLGGDELPAGTVDLLAARVAERGGDAGVVEAAHELVLHVALGRG